MATSRRQQRRVASAAHRRRLRRRPLPITCIAAMILLAPPPEVSAAHARRRPVAVRRPEENRYDRSITTFSDDGRLLQVEYGMAASNRGGTVACLDLEGLIEGGGVCFATSIGGGGGGDADADADADGGAAGTTGDAEFEKVHRVDDHALLVPTGLSGDGRALASSVRVACRRMRLTYGEPPTVSEIARTVAGMQHELTRMGGARPFGVTATVIGVDPLPEEGGSNGGAAGGGGDGPARAEEEEEEEVAGSPDADVDDPGPPQLYQSEPGGAVERCDFCSAGRGRRAALVRLGEVRRRALERRRGDGADRAAPEAEALAEIIRGVAEAALADSPDGEGPVGGAGLGSGNRGRVDVWLIRRGPCRRGGSHILMARGVPFGLNGGCVDGGIKELEEAARRLAAAAGVAEVY